MENVQNCVEPQKTPDWLTFPGRLALVFCTQNTRTHSLAHLGWDASSGPHTWFWAPIGGSFSREEEDWSDWEIGKKDTRSEFLIYYNGVYCVRLLSSKEINYTNNNNTQSVNPSPCFSIEVYTSPRHHHLTDQLGLSWNLESNAKQFKNNSNKYNKHACPPHLAGWVFRVKEVRCWRRPVQLYGSVKSLNLDDDFWNSSELLLSAFATACIQQENAEIRSGSILGINKSIIRLWTDTRGQGVIYRCYIIIHRQGFSWTWWQRRDI